VSGDRDGARSGVLGKSAGLTATQAGTWIFALAWVSIVPRVLGPAAFGRFVFAFSVLSIAVVVGGFGLESFILRAVARRDPESHVAGALRFGAAGLGVVLAGAAIAIAGRAPLLTAGLAAGLFLQGTGNLLFAILQGHERPLPRGVVDVASKGIFLAGSVLAARTSIGLGGIGVAYAAGYAAYAFGAVALVRARGWFPRGPVTTGTTRFLLRTAGPLGGHLIAQSIYYRTDSAMLEPIKGPALTGVYGAAYRIFDTLSFVTTIYAAVISPRQMRLARHEPEAAARLLRRSLLAMAGLGAAGALGIALLADPVISILFGPAYAGAIPLLRILGIALGLSIAATPLAWELLARDAQGLLATITGIAAVLNVASNLYAIPRHGATGAAVTTVLTEVVIVMLQAGAVRARRAG